MKIIEKNILRDQKKNQILQPTARKRQGRVADNLESFQTFKNHAKIRKEIIKNHANIDEVKRKNRSHANGFFSQRKR